MHQHRYKSADMTMLPMHRIGKFLPIFINENLLIKATTWHYVIVLNGTFGNPSCHLVSG